MPQIEFKNRNQATNFLAECAKLAYGSGMLEGKSGGNGNIGMLGDRVVKFRTHSGERSGEVTKNMADSCAELRNNLLNSVRALLVKDDGSVDEAGTAFIDALRRDLSIEDFQGNGSNSQKAKSLLDRKVVAKVIGKIEKFTNDHIFDMALNGQKPASSQGVDTTFKAVSTRQANAILAEYGNQMRDLAQSFGPVNWRLLNPEQKLETSLNAAKLLKNVADFVLNKSFADRFATYLSVEHSKSYGRVRATGEADMKYIRDNLAQRIGKWNQFSWGFLNDPNVLDAMQDLERLVLDEKAGAVVKEFEYGSKALRCALSATNLV